MTNTNGTITLADAKLKGGMLACYGGTNPAKAGLGGAFLSTVIEKVTNGPSHIALLLTDCTDSLNVIESTIYKGVSGPQLNPLEVLFEDYEKEGGHVDFYQFKTIFDLDLEGLMDEVVHLVSLRESGHLPYGILHLPEDLLARQSWLSHLVDKVSGKNSIEQLELLAYSNHQLVCSECFGYLCLAGNVDKKVKATGLSWLSSSRPVPGEVLGSAPGDYLRMGFLWEAPLRLVS
jgi:hypothetical protein